MLSTGVVQIIELRFFVVQESHDMAFKVWEKWLRVGECRRQQIYPL
jgi:hypothetical protein